MDDIFDENGSTRRHRRSVREMSEGVDSTYYAEHAAKARELAEQATAAGARNIHLEMAADYDARAAKAAAQ